MDLIATIGRGPVALDSAIFIYFIEKHPRYLSVLRELFTRIDQSALPAFTSGLTLLETLVVPYRAGNQELAARYEAMLTNGRGLALVPLDVSVLHAAARIRATTRVRTGDALQLASGLLTRSTAFLTNDRRIPALGGMSVLQLDDFVAIA
jgi:predicted nucleic acid-binding protein